MCSSLLSIAFHCLSAATFFQPSNLLLVESSRTLRYHYHYHYQYQYLLLLYLYFYLCVIVYCTVLD